MTRDRLIPEMIAWRSLLGTKPALVAAIQEVLQSWLVWQRTQPPDVSKPQLVVFLELSCLEDLNFHLGLAQLLSVPRIRCGLVLCFATEAMAQVVRAQARSEPWHGLVQFVGPSERGRLLASLPDDTPLAVLDGAAVLSSQCLETLFATKHDWHLLPHHNREGSDRLTFEHGSGFFGRAGDYSGVASHRPDDGWGPGALQLIERDLADLKLCPPPPVRTLRNQWPNGDCVIEPEALSERDVDIPAVETGDELILRTNRDPLTSEAVHRRFARLCPRDVPFKVRLSGSMLSTAPRITRLECYKPNGRVAATNLILRVSPTELEPWMISAFLNRGGGGNPVVRAFAQGIGCRLSYAEDEPENLTDIPVVWGVLRDSDRILAQAKSQLMYFFYIDHAYFDRGHGKSYRITRNRYEAGPIRRCPADRRGQLDIGLRPWRKAGREIIVCPPTDYFIEAHGCADWLDATLEALRNLTDRPITVRQKPQPGESAVPLKTALKSAHALVTHSSNVAIEAACLGTPVFVNPASAAAPIGQTDLAKIETPVYPDRDPWLHHLAYNQFSIEEIRSGEAWRLLRELEEREFA